MKWKKNEAQNSEARVEKLADEVRSTAQQSRRRFSGAGGQVVVFF
ncbi:hypothetical protein [uncultured Oscillibacter sp.]|jgi:hypothetical protein|nr:hypothetical protein [uncultured Oscillibacter sp.]